MQAIHQFSPASARCFGIDAEDGKFAVLVERCGTESLAAEWYPLDESGLDALATRVARCGDRSRVCVSSRGARALDVAGRVSRYAWQRELLLPVRAQPSGLRRTAFAQAAHASGSGEGGAQRGSLTPCR